MQVEKKKVYQREVIHLKIVSFEIKPTSDRSSIRNDFFLSV